MKSQIAIALLALTLSGCGLFQAVFLPTPSCTEYDQSQAALNNAQAEEARVKTAKELAAERQLDDLAVPYPALAATQIGLARHTVSTESDIDGAKTSTAYSYVTGKYVPARQRLCVEKCQAACDAVALRTAKANEGPGAFAADDSACKYDCADAYGTTGKCQGVPSFSLDQSSKNSNDSVLFVKGNEGSFNSLDFSSEADFAQFIDDCRRFDAAWEALK